jgi:hypothetical protein
MTKHKLLFILAMAAIVIIGGKLAGNKEHSLQIPSPELKLISNLLSDKAYDDALIAIERELSVQATKPTLSPTLHAWLYEVKAVIHANRRHFHMAISAMQHAQQHEATAQRAQYITDWQGYIDANQSERNKRSRYVAGNNLGLAKTLTNKITIAYIYINDGANKEWTGQRRLLNQTLFDQVLAFYQREAKKYQQGALEFDVRYFVMRSPKGIGKHMLRKYGTFEFLQQHFLAQSAYRDFGEFISDLQQNDKARQVALVFHTNHEARSYAFRCTNKQPECVREHVMLTEDISLTKQAWLVPQVQAHEILHLFGADDLYQINQAKDFAVTDVMNYFSSELNYATIDPITAWAIGWQGQPDTPFKIEEN